MKFRIKFADDYENKRVHLFVGHNGNVTKNEEWEKALVSIKETGYRAGAKELISIQKKDEYIYVEIDENAEVKIEE